MPPCLLIKAVIINSNYDEAPVLLWGWMPSLSLTIVLGISMTCNFSTEVFPHRPRGRKKNVFETLCWWGGYEQEQKKNKRPGTGGVIVVKWKSSSGFRIWKAALRSQCCAALLVHFEGKNSWNGEFFLSIFLCVMKSCISKICYLSNSWHCSNHTPKGF